MKKIMLFMVLLLVCFASFGQNRNYKLQFKVQHENIYIDTRDVNAIYITSSLHTMDDNVYGVWCCSLVNMDTVYVFPLIVLPSVTTCEVTNVTMNSALASGQVTDEGSSSVTERGVCWSTSHDPTTSDSHASSGGGMGSYSINIIGLAESTTYYVRAYATSREGTAYGDEVSFTTFEGLQEDWVDLGLPSGLLWATCNVGASSPEDYGIYFAWAETQPKSEYSWSTYSYCCNGSYNSLTKYCNNSTYGCGGYTDNLTNLQSGDDAAKAQWGGEARIPTKEEWIELYTDCTLVWITQNGVDGMCFTGPNGNSLFLPAAGCRYENIIMDEGRNGHYWSSSLYTNDPQGAWCFYNNSNIYLVSYESRIGGCSVRAVRSAE